MLGEGEIGGKAFDTFWRTHFLVDLANIYSSTAQRGSSSVPKPKARQVLSRLLVGTLAGSDIVLDKTFGELTMRRSTSVLPEAVMTGPCLNTGWSRRKIPKPSTKW